MRLFVALDIDDVIRQELARFIEVVRNFVPEARWVRPESLHVTLKFIGEKADNEVEKIEQTLASVSAESFAVNFRGYGFFPGARVPRVFWVGCAGGSNLTLLAKAVDKTLAGVSIAKEEHAFTAHLTLARGGRGSDFRREQKGDRPNRSFEHLQEKLAALPALDFGSTTAREFFLYRSQLSSGGSEYTKLARFTLR